MPNASLKTGINPAINAPLPPKCIALKPKPAYNPFATPLVAIISPATFRCSKTPAGEIPYAFLLGSWKSFFCTTERTTSPGAFGMEANTPARNPPRTLQAKVGAPYSFKGETCFYGFGEVKEVASIVVSVGKLKNT